MSNRTGDIRSTNLRPNTRVGNTDSGGHRVAAREADINTFNELMKERKRLNERVNEKNSGDVKGIENRSARQETLSASPQVGSLNLNHLSITKAKKEENPGTQVTLRSDQHIQISVASNTEASGLDQVESRCTDAVVAVIQRIIINQSDNKGPKQWLIQLGIDGEQTVDINLEYLGKDEWRLGLSRDGKSHESTEPDTTASTVLPDGLDELFTLIESGLKTAQPGLQLSKISSVR